MSALSYSVFTDYRNTAIIVCSMPLGTRLSRPWAKVWTVLWLRRSFLLRTSFRCGNDNWCLARRLCWGDPARKCQDSGRFLELKYNLTGAKLRSPQALALRISLPFLLTMVMGLRYSLPSTAIRSWPPFWSYKPKEVSRGTVLGPWSASRSPREIFWDLPPSTTRWTCPRLYGLSKIHEQGVSLIPQFENW
jgi:hypothetical protein